jgi:cytoskeletal protein CcmA (bactofilin family)
MNSLIDDLNAEQFNTFDPTTFLYLNPLFQHTYSNSIEKTYAFMVSNDYSVGYLTQNLTLNYPTFDYEVYYHYASNGIHDYFFDDADTFGGLPYFDRSNTKRLIDIYFSQHGVELDVFFEMDSNFNPEIYRLFHRIVQPMTTQELYIDYLRERENQSSDFLIGNIQELTMMVRSNVTLEFSDLVVREDGYVMNTLYVRNQAHIDGGMTIYGDGSNVVINGGGGLIVDATYNDINDALGNSTSEDPLNVVFSWITEEQIGMYLSGFSNDLAPWLTYDSKNIHLSQFSNDMGPWLSNITSVMNYSDDEITLFQSQTTKLNLGYLHKPIHNITTENIYIQNYLESIDGIINNSLSVGSNVYTSNLVSSNVITQNITILDDITIYDTLSVGSNVFTSNLTSQILTTENLYSSNSSTSNASISESISVGGTVYTDWLYVRNNASIGGTLTADGLVIVNGGSVEIGTT